MKKAAFKLRLDHILKLFNTRGEDTPRDLSIAPIVPTYDVMAFGEAQWKRLHLRAADENAVTETTLFWASDELVRQLYHVGFETTGANPGSERSFQLKARSPKGAETFDYRFMPTFWKVGANRYTTLQEILGGDRPIIPPGFDLFGVIGAAGSIGATADMWILYIEWRVGQRPL